MNLSESIVLSEVGGRQTTLTFSSLLARKKYTLLYFYPKDSTPGCTLEGQDFTRLLSDFDTLSIQVIGVSRDTHESHGKFQSQCGIGIDLIADHGFLIDSFSVMGEKNMYGKIVFSLLRSTFLLDQSAHIMKEWRNVRAKGHAERVLKECREQIAL